MRVFRSFLGCFPLRRVITSSIGCLSISAVFEHRGLNPLNGKLLDNGQTARKNPNRALHACYNSGLQYQFCSTDCQSFHCRTRAITNNNTSMNWDCVCDKGCVPIYVYMPLSHRAHKVTNGTCLIF